MDVELGDYLLVSWAKEPVEAPSRAPELRLLCEEAGAAVPREATRALPVPAGPGDLASHYDLTISHPAVDQAPFAAFDRWLGQAAADRGLACALVHDRVVHDVTRRLERGQLTIGFHLDYFALWHVPGDPYARLAEAVQDAGGRPINPPARARTFTDKAAAHAELERRGLGVPATVVLRPGVPDRGLTDAERARLGVDEPGACLYLKPANGFGSRGVVRAERTDADSLLAALTAARNQNRQDTLLVQREVRCPRLVCEDGQERPAYWRVLYCLGEVFPFWWRSQEVAPGRPSYRPLTVTETRRHHLQPVLDFVTELIDLSGLKWFSTELCLSDGREPSRCTVRGGNGLTRPVVAIDYINDQCDVDVQSRWPGAPPDGLVRRLAECFAEAAWQQRHGSRLRLAA